MPGPDPDATVWLACFAGEQVACFLLLSLREVDPATGLPTYPEIDVTLDLVGYPDERIPWPIPLKALLFYQLFGWLWTCWFLNSVQFTALAGAIASWYRPCYSVRVRIETTSCIATAS